MDILLYFLNLISYNLYFFDELLLKILLLFDKDDTLFSFNFLLSLSFNFLLVEIKVLEVFSFNFFITFTYYLIIFFFYSIC